MTSARSFSHLPPPRGRSVLAWTAAALGAAFAFNLVSAARAERRHPPQGRFVEVDGVKLHYLDKGEGSPIVLIHGNGVMARDWVLSGVFDALARNHRVIAFDRPGFGHSTRPRSTVWSPKMQAELLAKAMDRLGAGRAVVVGHSLGALVALHLALEHPERVSALGLLSGYYRPSPRLDALASTPAVPGVGDVIRYTVSPLLGWAMTPLVYKAIFAPSKVTRAFKTGFPASLALRPSQIRASSADAALMVPDAAKIAGRFGELAMPVLIMAGDGDRVVSTAYQSKGLAKRIPQSRLEILPGVGHMIHHVARERVASAVESLAG